MKKQILLIMMAGIFYIPSIHPTATYAESSEVVSIQQTSRIDLKGNLEKKGGFRSGTDPIVVEQQGTILSILFQKDVGTLLVNVAGTQGQVYATSVDTSTQSVLTIPMTGLSAGNYTIAFTNENGTMWGEFVL